MSSIAPLAGRAQLADAFAAAEASAVGAFRARLGPDPEADVVDAALDRIARHHGRVLAEQRRAYAPGDPRPASERVAAHVDALGALVDELWNPRLAGLEALVAGATVTVRRGGCDD